MEKIYLAGAMKAYEGTEKAKEWRDITKLWFKDYSNFKIISPTDYYEYGKNKHYSEEEIMKFDLRMVKKSDIVLVNLDKLEESDGTKDEICYAYLLGKAVIGFLETNIELTKDELKEIIHPWKLIEIDRIETGVNAMYKAIEYINDFYG